MNEPYEVTFSNEAMTFDLGESLQTAIPRGSYSFDYATEEEYAYVYIRMTASADQPASYALRLEPLPMVQIDVQQVCVEKETDAQAGADSGTVSGAGRYEYGAEFTLTAVPADNHVFNGWYENGELVSEEPVYSTISGIDRTFVAQYTETEPEEPEEPEVIIVAGWKKNSNGWWYQNADGTYPKSAWQKIDGEWYHFDSKGYMQTGWQKISGKWYYFNTGGDIVTGCYKIGSMHL